ncbi:hypothetical protein XENTR_v10001798 [Xenopus tropicalis]|nr:hypothetical protein XENTR_v10001798 [Xenopus tropicalis]KAE8633154.1 hypothetical protein XENTR_v10001798 [Xenopus tropicalis]
MGPTCLPTFFIVLFLLLFHTTSVESGAWGQKPKTTTEPPKSTVPTTTVAKANETNVILQKLESIEKMVVRIIIVIGTYLTIVLVIGVLLIIKYRQNNQTGNVENPSEETSKKRKDKHKSSEESEESSSEESEESSSEESSSD